MRYVLRGLTAGLLIATAAPAVAEVSIHDCLKAARAIKAGTFTKLEYLGFTDEQQAAFEIEVRTPGGREWEFECSAADGTILEIEQEVETAGDPLFADAAKVSEQDARAIATRVYPGTIEEVEYEIEANGDPVYEFDVIDVDGIEFKIEVHAVTGDIVEVQIENWEIGEEDRR